jgi:hopanoid biosynthesis associated radical SAM protein HpnH
MRFPFSLPASLTGYLLRKKCAGQKRFPLVLMLEPLHACNLSCAGCGRLREYGHLMGSRMSVKECLDSVEECGAPVVSVCGGEPLIYPDIEELIARLVERKKHVYLCTNGLLLEKKLTCFKPSSRLCFNVHLDGMEATHDRAVGHAGAFAAAARGIQAAKERGFRVSTNTTVYRDSDVNEIAVLFNFLAEYRVDGLMLSPAYGYAAVRQADPGEGERMFMTREEIREKFRRLRELVGKFRLTASPLYMEFLCGERELPCAAWASPTRNVAGWRGPCYLVADAHYPTYQELLSTTDWNALGPGGDPRCEHCLMHSGFEPGAVLDPNRRWRDLLKMAVWQMQ